MLNIPLQLSRIAIYFSVRKPTKAEWEDDSITKIELTADDTVWDPTSSEFSDQEAVTMNYRGEVIKREATERVNFFINSVGTCFDAADIKDDKHFGLALENEVSVSRVGVLNSTTKPKVDYLIMINNWGIFTEIAKRTLQFTNQSDIRNVLHPY